MNIRLFGTYDERRHPRVRVLREGLAASAPVRVDNVPVPIDTAMRVDALRHPLRLLRFVPTLLWAWVRLAARSRRGPRPDVVVVGHLGHLDVLLARMLFPRATLVLDYLISLADTARDRKIGERGMSRLLELGDRFATRVADLVVLDTPESMATVPAGSRQKAVVVPVGADQSWFAAGEDRSPRESALSIVFFGLYTPLQGAPVIGAALRLLHERGVAVRATMVGAGQERAATERACGGAPVTWIDWVDAEDLPSLVSDHDVCLGIFGTGPKARRVVPNKLYQGAAAGCAIITSETPPQRRALPPARFVPPGDSAALADALEALTDDDEVARRAEKAGRFARAHHRSESVVDGLTATLNSGSIDSPQSEAPVHPNDGDPHDPPLTPRAWLRHDLIWSCLDGLPPEARVLEVGAGQGAMAVRLARRFRYTGVEADDTAANIARARLSEAGLPHQLHHGRFEDIQLERPYDALCAFEVLEHIEDDAATLGRWMDVLVPGGRLVLSVPAWQDRFGPWDEQVGHYRRYEPDGLVDLLHRVGFVAADVHLYGFPLANVLEIVRNRLASPDDDAAIEERTAASGRLLQPSSTAAAVATDLATRPFRLFQRLSPSQRRGTGIVAAAQRPR